MDPFYLILLGIFISLGAWQRFRTGEAGLQAYSKYEPTLFAKFRDNYVLVYTMVRVIGENRF